MPLPKVFEGARRRLNTRRAATSFPTAPEDRHARGRPKSDVWTYFDGDKKTATCRRCQYVISNAKVEKLERHILKKCAHWTPADRAAYIKRHHRQQTNRPRTSIGASPSFPDEDKGPVQITQYELNKLVSNMVFTSGFALRIVERPGFFALCLAGRPGLSVPAPSLLTGRLLDEDFDCAFKDFVSHVMLQQYVALVVDGCTSVSHQKGVNFVLVGPNFKAKLYITKVTGSDSQTGEYMAELIGQIADEVDRLRGRAGFVGSVVTDNAQAMQAVWMILEKTRRILCSGCGAHTLNLLIQDMLKLQPMGDTLNGLASYFLQRSQLLARFVQEQEKMAQLRKDEDYTRTFSPPVATRWYSVFNGIVWVIKNLDAIGAIFKDPEIVSKYKSRKKKTVSKNEAR